MNSYDLFHLFFSQNMKSHIMQATKENDCDLSEEDLDKLITILILSSFNIRKRQRHYWSEKSTLKLDVVKNLMTRNKFEKIKKKYDFTS